MEKWISDRIDGKLSEKKRIVLDAHLTGCASCRAYEEHLEKIQDEARSLAAKAVAPEYWQASVVRLQAKLKAVADGGQKSRYHQSPAFFPPARWAWIGAASLLVVALGLYVVFFRAGTPQEVYPYSYEETVNSIYREIGNNTDLEKEFNSALQASINEHAGEVAGEVNHLVYGNSFFLESLSEEEIKLLDSEIKKELKL
jgi:thiol-disulfide isomerase/thioredoxin